MNKTLMIALGCILLAGTQVFVQGGIVSQWNCNEASLSTTLTDNVGSANGTLEDKTSTYPGEFPPATAIPFVVSGAGLYGDYGNALNFGALNDQVNLGEVDAFDFGQNDFTVTGWFRTSNSARHGRIILHGDYNSGGFSVLIYKTQGKVDFEVYGSTGAVKLLMGDNVVTNGQWHWFAAVVQNQTMYLYVDGVRQTNSGVTFDPGTTASATGFSTYIDRDAAASIDQLTIYNTALTGTVDANNTLVSGELFFDWYGMPLTGPANCEEVKASGYQNLADLNGDCTVNLQDFAMMASSWLYCNDPADINCSRPWQN